MATKIDEIKLKSVGIDVGSSTSHLVFSKLTLQRDETSPSRRFIVTNREIIFEGRIIDTPLLDSYNIDTNALISFFKEEYEKAGISPEKIDTGAVIVTGETAKKENAELIVEQISKEAGKFVVATAGPNFESMLAAMGSGATTRSLQTGKTILNVDVGGGTSNIAISQKGNVISTACVSVGGRLLAIENGKIWRIDNPTGIVMNYLDLSYNLGDFIPEKDIIKIASCYAQVLKEVISGPTTSNLTKKLMITENLDFSIPIDEVSFSGGVGELIYGNSNDYGDIGHYLADEINKISSQLIAPVIEPKTKIRATVIGAGAFSLSISGSTTYMDDNISFPLRNIPVIKVDVDRTELSIEHVKKQIKLAFQRFDIKEGTEIVALYFKDPVRAAYQRLKLFSEALANSIPNSIKNEIPIILVFKRDIANSIGNVMKREGIITQNLLSIDELILNNGDWIDIGEPLVNKQVFPVTVKSLIFNKPKNTI